MRTVFWVGLVLLSLGLVGAKAAESVELKAPGGGRVWVYLPPAETAAAPAALACVLVPPAGSRLFHGMRLEDGDRAEHRPWVQAGFAVVSFDISGEVSDLENEKQVSKAITRFLAADLGVLDAKRALDVALKRFPQIDRARIYVSGHSSAGTLALQIAASELKPKACVALAPANDFEERFNPEFLAAINELVPGGGTKLMAKSPMRLAKDIHCPVFLFHAMDDENVTPREVEPLKRSLESGGVTVKYSSVATGGHYDSMIQRGLPEAVAWLTVLEKRDAAPAKRQP